jgi:hypothetical protein
MKTPQEKKKLSYRKDRRNTYGENGKSSRKSIRLSKALDIRAVRHAQDQVLLRARSCQAEDAWVDVEVRTRDARIRQWEKIPDQPLGEVLLRKKLKR